MVIALLQPNFQSFDRFADMNKLKHVITLTFGVLCIALSSSALSLSNSQKQALDNLVFDRDDSDGFAEPHYILEDENGIIIGYTWRLVNPGGIPGNSINSIVYVPGFNIQADINKPAPEAGSVDSYYELAGQLLQGQLVDNGNDFFVEELTSNSVNTVYLVEFVDNSDSVENNSRVIEELLTNIEFLAEIGNKKPALFGYSMGGIVARHSLLALESSGIQHPVGAYVSLDAPHRGAFLPPSIEVNTRTIRNDAPLLIGEARDALDLAISLYDSPAAKELLGIYIGQSVPRYKAFVPLSGGWEVRKNWKDYKVKYDSMIENNSLTRHPSFFSLRENMVQMGGYPSLTLNVGVTFGRADSVPLMLPEERSTYPAKIRLQIGSDAGVSTSRYYSIANPNNLCLNKFIFKENQPCPSLNLTGQDLEAVFTAPGSAANSFRALTKGVDVDANSMALGGALGIATVGAIAFAPGLAPISALGSAAAIIGVTSNNFSNEDLLTFIPIASALDAKEWAAVYPWGAPIDSLQTPFDVVIADQVSADANISGMHSVITRDVYDKIFSALYSASAFNRQKSRVNYDQFPGSPDSSYFNVSGDFDIPRYITRESVRELPVVADSEVPESKVPIAFTNSIIGAVISAGYVN